ncbi:MAG TPA: hypothetical protein VF315_02570, partial [Steroidobacteraceae bacterium]
MYVSEAGAVCAVRALTADATASCEDHGMNPDAVASAARANPRLTRSSDDLDRDFFMLIDGQWIPARSGATFSCVDPYSERAWGRIPAAEA